jgi:hypothetical protein
VGELTLLIVLHAGLGLLLALVVTAAGVGMLSALRGRDALHGPDAVYAYPLGLGVCIAAAVLYLVSPWLAPASALLVGAPLAACFARRVERVAARALPPFVTALPGALGVAFALGFLFHAPTSELDSRAYGDMLYYDNKLVSAGQSLAPFRDLLVEGEKIIYAEAAPSFLGAALAGLPGFDAVLFHTTTLSAFLLASLALGLGLLSTGRSRVTPFWLPVIGLLAASAVIYPTWIVESPPIALALPLTLVVYRLYEAPPPTPWLAAIAGLCALELLGSKVVATIPLVVVVVIILARRYVHRLDLRTTLLVVGGVASAAAAAITLLFLTADWYTGLLTIAFLPADAVRGLRDQLDVRSAPALSPTFEIVGQVLLLTALVRIRAVAFAAALALSICAVWFVGGQGFDAALSSSILLAALLFWRYPELFAQERALVLAAATSLIFSAWLRDIAGVRAALALVVLLAAALVGAFEGASRPLSQAASRLLQPAGIVVSGVLFALAGAQYAGVAAVLLLTVVVIRRPAFAVPALVLGILAPAGLAARTDDPRLGAAYYPLTTDDYDAWHHVEELVPPDGLVFTSETGTTIDGRHGWNNYPSIAGRQLYLAGWYDGRLVSDRDEVARRVALNQKVLAGELPPTELGLERVFGSYYAVVRREERVPASFALVHSNERFALYRLPQ